MKIEIGKQGNQPFAINALGVSRIHAILDINEEKGVWTLTDHDSTNGTFVRDEKSGCLRRITEIPITPMTFICLGPDNKKGCSFYARQLLSPKDYDEELYYINQKEDEYDAQREKVERNTSLLRLTQTVLPLIIFGLSMLLWDAGGPSSYMLRTAGAAIPSAILQFLFDPRKQMTQLNAHADLFRHCPNPECSNKLRPQDIRNRECPHCNKI